MRKYASVDKVGAVLAALVGLTYVGCETSGSDAPGAGVGSGTGGASEGGPGPDVATGNTGGASMMNGEAGVEADAPSEADSPSEVGSSEAGDESDGRSDDGDASSDGRKVTFACLSPQAVTVLGIDTGYDQCAGGFVRRRAIVTCPSELPRARTCTAFGDGGASGATACTSDADCSAQPLGHCELPNSGYYGGCRCVYGCTTDAECGPDRICLCGSPVGTCVPAGCKSDTDCGTTSLCTSYERTGIFQPPNVLCPQLGFSCQSAMDQCAGNGDCSDSQNNRCAIVRPDAGRSCTTVLNEGCTFGRPFIVRGTATQGVPQTRVDWAGDELHPDVRKLDPVLRAELTAKWRDAGAMEHASVAAFARFSLQLLALGAPVDLVKATQQAMADETEHAQLCFAMASAYGGAPIGPGRLPIDGALESDDLEHVLALAVREGIVGETIAAAEAHEGAEHARDPVVRRIFEKIAADETRHAELAVRFTIWAIEHGGAPAREVVREEVAAALARARTRRVAVARTPERDTSAHGWMNAARRAALECETLVRVVEPCVRALLAQGVLDAA